MFIQHFAGKFPPRNPSPEVSETSILHHEVMSAIDVPPERPPNEPQTVTEEIVEGQVDTTDTKMRYLAYVNRFRTIALASSRYLAYTSGSPHLILSHI
jgi:hypothetical protein